MMYRIKNAPIEVRRYFEKRFPMKDGFTYRFYWYRGREGKKIYGCEVDKKSKLWHNATQASESWFRKENNKLK